MSGPNFDTSATLLARLRAAPDDTDAWRRFVGTYGPRIVNWCQHWGLQDADAHDVAQVVILRFWNQIARFEYDPSGSFRGWLRKLTHAAWCDFVERQRPWHRTDREGKAMERLVLVAAREDLLERLEAQFDLELLDLAMARVRAGSIADMGRVPPARAGGVRGAERGGPAWHEGRFRLRGQGQGAAADQGRTAASRSERAPAMKSARPVVGSRRRLVLAAGPRKRSP